MIRPSGGGGYVMGGVVAFPRAPQVTFSAHALPTVDLYVRLERYLSSVFRCDVAAPAMSVDD